MTGTEKWWLPHCALKNSKIETDVQVDWYGHAVFSASHYGHPFGSMFPMQMLQSSYDDFVNVLCNKKEVIEEDIVRMKSLPTNKALRKKAILLNESQRLSIALQMRHPHSDMYKYKYCPSHIIFDEQCMLIQSCAFQVVAGGNVPHKISLSEFDPQRQDHVIVREIAFGPPLSPSDRHLALYFDIHDDEIYKCTLQEQSRHKRVSRKLRTKKKNSTRSSSAATRSYAEALRSKYNFQDGIKRGLPRSFKDAYLDINNIPFRVCIPKDEDSYELVTKVIRNSWEMENHPAPVSPFFIGKTSMTRILEENAQLRQMLNSIVRHSMMFELPVNHGRSNVDENTPVPKANQMFIAPPSVPDHDGSHQNLKDPPQVNWHESFKVQVWESFVETVSIN